MLTSLGVGFVAIAFVAIAECVGESVGVGAGFDDVAAEGDAVDDRGAYLDLDLKMRRLSWCFMWWTCVYDVERQGPSSTPYDARCGRLRRSTVSAVSPRLH